MAFTQIRTPPLPMLLFTLVLFKTVAFNTIVTRTELLEKPLPESIVVPGNPRPAI